MSGTDWVDVWKGLRGSRDFRSVVEAGEQLCTSVELARKAWAERAGQHRGELAEKDGEICAMQAALENVYEDARGSELASTVRWWHDRVHAEPWAVCRHVLCRLVLISFDEVQGLDLAHVPATALL